MIQTLMRKLLMKIMLRRLITRRSQINSTKKLKTNLSLKENSTSMVRSRQKKSLSKTWTNKKKIHDPLEPCWD